jgi:hypothetical protein
MQRSREKNVKKCLEQLTSSSQLITFRVMQYFGVKKCFTIWGIWVKKDAVFGAASKNVNLP